MEKKIAIVVQRYGLEVNGGAEFHARILAEQLAKKYDTEILTTTALDYHGWENHYAPGVEVINGITVWRFPTYKQSAKRGRRARRAIYKKKKYFKILKFLGIFEKIDDMLKISNITKKNIDNWLAGQGPYVPGLIKYISLAKEKYDVFIFFTYLYYPTVVGMPVVSQKSIFIPTAHDEPLLYTKPYEYLFTVPKFIMYNTESEKQLIERNFENYTKNSDIAGVGISRFHGETATLPENIKAKKYFVYIGRIDSAKGCGVMIEYFINFLNTHPQYQDYKLLLVGKNYMKKTYKHSSVIYTGFIDEDLKHSYLINALAMIMPSFYESLSLVTLEAMIEYIPVIVNKKCAVLYHHIEKSGSGDAYENEAEFYQILDKYLTIDKQSLEIEGKKAAFYVENNYTWTNVLEKFDDAIRFVTRPKMS